MYLKKLSGVCQLFFILLVLITISDCNIAFASSGNWIEVARLTGVGGIGSTETFTVDHVDWRIRWEIEPGDGSARTSFLAYIFPSTGIKGSEPWFDSIQHFGTEETTGILNVYNHSGSFYMDVLASIESYTMIIEQNVDSIPEFPLLAPMLLVFAVLAVTLAVYKRKLRNLNQREAYT